MMHLQTEDKQFMKRTALIAIPVAFQGLLNNILNMVDTLMIGTLGEMPLASVGLANKVFFVLALLMFGITSGSTVLTAQYWGNKDLKNARKVLGISLILALSAAFIFCLAGTVFPYQVMRIFTPSQETVASGSAYLRIVALAYPFQAISQCYIFFNRAVNRVKMTVTVSVIAILINIVINYTLIGGNFGFPAMGVRGAAIGTLIARIFECVVIVSVIYFTKSEGAARFKELFSFNKSFIKRYFVVVTPVIFNEFLWGLGVTLYSLVYGRMGDAAVATITVAQIIEEMFVVFFMGLSSATGVILGNEMGADMLDSAQKHARQFLKFTLGLSILFALVLFLSRGIISGFFNVSDNVVIDVQRCLTVFAVYMPFKMNNYVNIVGILRSGGDTKYALFLDFSGVWFIGVPLAFIGGLVLKFPIYVVYAMLLFEEVYKSLLGFGRYRTKKWVKNIS